MKVFEIDVVETAIATYRVEAEAREEALQEPWEFGDFVYRTTGKGYEVVDIEEVEE